MTCVLVTRARDDAERTAGKLRGLGFTPLISPVIEIVATGAAIPHDAFDAALATSARAIVHSGDRLAALSSLPFYVVGARTAQALEARGLRVAATAPDVAGLISMLQHGSPQRFLYLAGRDRKDDLETFLRMSGREVTTIETYEARAAPALSDEAIAALSRGEVGAVLHYSTRSAAIFLELARNAPLSVDRSARNDGSLPLWVVGVAHLALSEDVARILRNASRADVRVASSPDEKSLLEMLKSP